MDQINFFKCLSDSTRLSIVLLLHTRGEMCVCDLTDSLQLSQPKISRHLALLKGAGLLQDRREGQWVHYSLSNMLPSWCDKVITALLAESDISKLLPSEVLIQNCCE